MCIPFFVSLRNFSRFRQVSRRVLIYTTVVLYSYKAPHRLQSSPFFLSQPANDAGAREATGVRCEAARDFFSLPSFFSNPARPRISHQSPPAHPRRSLVGRLFCSLGTPLLGLLCCDSGEFRSFGRSPVKSRGYDGCAQANHRAALNIGRLSEGYRNTIGILSGDVSFV